MLVWVFGEIRSGSALHWLLQTHFATGWYNGESVVHVVTDQVTHTFKPVVFSADLDNNNQKESQPHVERKFYLMPLCCQDSPLLLGQPTEGAWPAPPVVPWGHTARALSQTHEPKSLHHGLAAAQLPGDSNSHETRTRTAAAPPEEVLLLQYSDHCVRRHPRHRQTAL